jgi:hypothetical protein
VLPSSFFVDWRERRGSESWRTSCLAGSPRSSSSVEALLKSSRVWQRFLSSTSVDCRRLAKILWIDRKLTLEYLCCIEILACRDTHDITTVWVFSNHSKSLIRFSYVICPFTYCIVELVFVLSFIRSRVWGSIEYSGTWCGNYYLIPRRLTTLIWRKILDCAVDEVSEAFSMHVTPPAIRIVVVPTGVTVLLGLQNPSHRWTGTVGPSIPSFTIAPSEEILLRYRLIRWPKSILQGSPKI